MLTGRRGIRSVTGAQKPRITLEADGNGKIFPFLVSIAFQKKKKKIKTVTIDEITGRQTVNRLGFSSSLIERSATSGTRTWDAGTRVNLPSVVHTKIVTLRENRRQPSPSFFLRYLRALLADGFAGPRDPTQRRVHADLSDPTDRFKSPYLDIFPDHLYRIFKTRFTK